MLEIKSVSFSYGPHKIFSNINYTFEQNSFYCIIGMNGSGKSTFAKLVVGILAPQSGKITYNKNDLSVTNIGYIQQKLHINPDIPISVKDFVLMGALQSNTLFFSKKNIMLAESLLEQCGLLDKISQPLYKLSGGQIQKALIARLLMSKPEIIVLDEPFVSLDVLAHKELLSMLKQLKGTSTILLISHEANIISELTDKVLCISNDQNHHDYIEYFLVNKKIPVQHLCQDSRQE